MRRPLFAPRTFLIFVASVLFLGLVFEVLDFVRVEAKIRQLNEHELVATEERLFAIIRMASERKLSHTEIADVLSRYYALSEMKGFVEIFYNNRSFYHSPNLEPGHTLQSLLNVPSQKGFFTSSFQSRPIAVLSKTEGNYRFVVGLPLDDKDEFGSGVHSYLSLFVSLSLFVLAGIGLLSIYILHRPMRAMQQYIKGLAAQPKVLPLPQTPGILNRDANELVREMHGIVDELHRSKVQALEFSSLASHELRTPLALIRNQLETALSPKTSNRRLRMTIGMIYDEMLKLNGTVEDLLNLSTYQAGIFRLNLDTFTLEHFLKQFYDEALFLTRAKDITVVLKKGPHVVIEADQTRLRQVFFNLLDNSIKNTANGGKIRISYDLVGSEILITFADTGRGIPAENLNKIFEPFFKEAPIKMDGRGAGLGLALVKWIIEVHKGKVSVESHVGKGTTFYLRLPLYQQTSVTLVDP